MLLAFLVLVVIVSALVLLKSWIRVALLALSLPGPPAWPILGNVLLVKDTKALAKLGQIACQIYGPLVRGWVALVPIVVVLEPKYLQKILGSSKFTNKNFMYAFMHTFLGQGLITSNGYKWKSHRKYIQPYLDINYLALLLQSFSDSAMVMVEELKNERQVKITGYINRCVLDVLHQTILGIPISEQEVKKQSPFTKGHVAFVDRLSRPWLLLNCLYNCTFSAAKERIQEMTLQQYSKKVLKQRRLEKLRGAILPWCLLDALIDISENNPNFNDKDIVDELCTFMLAGQDSVGAALAFTMYFLADNPEIQEKVYEEVNEAPESPEVRLEDLNRLKYLEQCIKEAMRLCPSVPFIARKLTEDLVVGKHTLPAGTNIAVSAFATHRHPDYYPDAERFDPERFSPENSEKRHPYAYLPFSAGPRNCIGYKFALLEMKAVIATLIRRYRFSVVPGYKLELLYRVTLRARGGIQLKISPR